MFNSSGGLQLNRKSSTYSSLVANYHPAASSQPGAAGAQKEHDYTSISLDLPGGKWGEWPNIWLRDNCQCKKCIHPDTRQRLVDTFSISANLQAVDVRKYENYLEITWGNDGHTSTYSLEWLANHILRQSGSGPETVKFSAEKEYVPNDPKSYPTVVYDEVMSSDEGVRKWTDQIYQFGFSFVKGSPATPEATEKLLERIAFIRPTHYGGFWDFTSDLSLKDMAYTTEGLGGHTDTTYFTDPAGLQLFHMLSHTNGGGGESLLVDAFEAAKTLHREDPEAYQTLKEFGISGHASGNEDVCIQPARPFPVLNHHPVTGELYQVRWNNEDRRPSVDASPERIKKWYLAAGKWNEIIRRKDMERWFQLEPGTPMINHDDFMSRFMLLRDGREKVLSRI
ncbi:hypothetical protein FQN53_002246 [Emmonsiellopsis sp. PD_33]|nr:hypothetical protein FQN53_002246 [Emmonsiellopsis sp. PD_33]